MSALYELVGDYKRLEDHLDDYVEMIQEGEMSEDAFFDTLDAISSSIEEKLDNLACLIKSLNADATAIAEEELRLRQRRKVKENAAERLKEYLTLSMSEIGMDRLDTARNRISFRKSEKVAVENEPEFIQWAQEYRPELLKYKAPEINKTEIKKIIKSGYPVEGCRIEQCQNIQIK